MSEYNKIYQLIDGCIDKLNLEEGSATSRAYTHGLVVFMEFLRTEFDLHPEAPYSALTIDHLIQFPSYLLRNYRRSTCNVYMSAVDYFLERFLILNKLIHPDISDVMRYNEEKRHMMRKAEQYVPRNVSEKDIDRMIDAARQLAEDEPRKSRNIALVLFLASSGLRNAEATALRCRDVSWNSTYDKPFVRVEAGKGGKSRDVPFSREAWEAIKTYWKQRGWQRPDDPVFARHDKGAGKKHKPMSTSTTRNIISEIRDASGIEAAFTPHYFRHGCATRILRKTGNIEVARQQLGHSNIGTTAMYTHLIKEDLVEAHNKVFGE